MFYVISGCSSGGKTTLINALASRGYGTSEEPGRIIVRKELDSGGHALPWENPVAFAIKCVEFAVQQHEAATLTGKLMFFDRSLVDAVSALIHEDPIHTEQHLQLLDVYRYATTVFMAAPWPEVFQNDSERMHTFADAVEEYDRLIATYTMAGYSIQTLPKAPVPERIDFVLKYIK